MTPHHTKAGIPSTVTGHKGVSSGSEVRERAHTLCPNAPHGKCALPPFLDAAYSRGRQTVASDVELLVVYTGAVRGDTYALVRHTLNIWHLESHVYAAEEYAQVRETLERMVQGGISVYSSEPEPGPVTIATV